MATKAAQSNGKTARIEIPAAIEIPASSIAIFDVVGISPLLMNNPLSMARQPSGIAVKKIPAPAEEAAGKVYRLPSGQLFVPATWFRSSLLAATTGRRFGKFAAGQIISGAVQLVPGEEKCPLVNAKTGKPITDYVVDTRRCVVQGQGVLRSRPSVEDWATTVVFEVDPQFIADPRTVEELLNIAGKIKGIGDNRPQKKGESGRYRAKMRTA